MVKTFCLLLDIFTFYSISEFNENGRHKIKFIFTTEEKIEMYFYVDKWTERVFRKV